MTSRSVGRGQRWHETLPGASEVGTVRSCAQWRASIRHHQGNLFKPAEDGQQRAKLQSAEERLSRLT